MHMIKHYCALIISPTVTVYMLSFSLWYRMTVSRFILLDYWIVLSFTVMESSISSKKKVCGEDGFIKYMFKKVSYYWAASICLILASKSKVCADIRNLEEKTQAAQTEQSQSPCDISVAAMALTWSYSVEEVQISCSVAMAYVQQLTLCHT